MVNSNNLIIINGNQNINIHLGLTLKLEILTVFLVIPFVS